MASRKPTSQSEVRELITQFVLLNERFANLESLVSKSVSDYEKRLRDLEDGRGKTNQDVAILRERMGTFNLAQVTLTAIATAVGVWLSRR